jgi:hypothetical protein
MNWPSWSSFLSWIGDALIAFFNSISTAFLELITWFINLIPNQPDLPSVSNTLPSYIINAVCWVLPVPAILSSLGIWSASLIIYFAVKAFLRWL